MRKPISTLVILLCIVVFPAVSFAQTTSWRGITSTSWATASNWTNGIPTATTDVIIGDANFTGVNQPTISATAYAKSLTIGGTVTSILTVKKTTTVSTGVLINTNGSIVHTTNSITVKDNWVNNGSYSATGTGCSVIFGGTVQSIQGSAVTTFRKLTINAGSVTTLNTNVTVSGSSSILAVKGTLNPNESPTYKITGTALTVYSSAVLKITGALFSDNYTMSGTVTFNAGSIADYSATLVNQTISSLYTYSTLTISGANTKSLAANLPTIRSTASTYGNILVNAGTLDLSTYTATRGTSVTGGTLMVANGATLKIDGTNSIPANYATVTFSLTSTVDYYGTNQTVSARTYGNLKLSSSSGASVKTMPATAFTIAGDFTGTQGTGSSVAYTAASNITINGQVIIGSNTTFNGGAFTHTIGNNWTNNGTYQGTTSTVVLNGAGSLVSGSGTNNFYNLTIGASAVSAAATTAINVAGDLSTTGPGAFTHTAGGTLSMTGTTKTISGTGIVLANLTVTGTTSTASSLTITDNLSVSGSFTSTTGTISMTGSTKNLAGAGTILFAALKISGSITATANFSISSSLDISGSFSATAGTATFTNTATLNGTANLFNVTVNGTSLILSASSVLGIANVLTISAGTLDVSSNKPNTVTFNGTVPQNINAITYHHLVLANGTTKTALGNTTINGNLTIGSGATFVGSSFTHNLAGNWINNGSFSAGTSTVVMNGSTNASITGVTTFSTLTINKASSSNTVSLNNNIFTPLINMTMGSMNTGSNSITITNNRTGTGIILGTIIRTHSFTTGTAYEFEGPDNRITFSAVSGVTSITVNVTVGNVADFPNGGAINRVYTMTVPVGTYTATLRLHYEDAELNGNNESLMALSRFNGTNWILSGKTGFNTTTNYVEQSGLTDITNRWTCSDDAGVVTWNGSVSSDWNTAANWTVMSGAPAVPPSANDIVQLGNTVFTNQPQISTAVTVKSIVFGSAKATTLTLATGGSLTANGNISGTWLANATHTINTGNQALTVNGDLVLSDGTTSHIINLVSGTSSVIAVNGSLIETGGAAITFTGNTILNIKNDFTYTSGTFTAGTSTVTYNGTASQNIAPVTYYNLSIDKTAGIAVANNAFSIGGNLVVNNGDLDMNAALSIAGNATISVTGKLYGEGITIQVGGNWGNSGLFVAGTGTVMFNGAGAQTISATTFNNVVINKSTNTATLTGNLVINGDLSVQTGTLNLSTFTANRSAVGGQIVLGANTTLLVGGGNNFPQSYASNNLTASSTVNYNGTIAQTVAAANYGKLVFTNGGATAKTLNASITINNDITINSGSTFNASSYTINLAGNWVNNGTFTPGTSVLVLNGASKTITGNTTFYRVTVYGSYTVANNDITYNGLLNVTPTGSYAGGSGVATLNGDLTNSGILTSTGTTTFTGTSLQTIHLINALVSTSTGIVNFNGNVSPILNSTSTPTFANLNINNTAGINPSVDWLVLGSMTIGTGGIFNGGGSTHIIKGNFTNNGTVTSSGTIDFEPTAAVTLKLAGTSFSSTGIVLFGGAGLSTITGTPASLYDVRITNTNAAGITPPSGWTITNDFIINSNSTFNAGTYTYLVGGDIESNGTLNGGSSTFTMSSSTGQLTGSPNTLFNHFTITGSITANSDFYVAGNFTNNGVYDGNVGTLIMTGSNAATIGGTTTPSTISQLTINKSGSAVVTLATNISEVFSLFITTGTLFTSTYSITQDAGGGVLMISDFATLKLGGTNSLPGFSGYGLDIYSTVDYAGTNQNIGNAASYGNLTISTAGTKSGVVPLIIQNDFTLSAGTFSAPISVTHSIAGDWIMTGGTFLNASNTILFNGTTDQDITSTGAFNNVTINKTSGLVTLSSNVTVNAVLNLTAGKVSIGSRNLVMGNSGTITNASVNSYVIANGSGSLTQQILFSGSKHFPVGLPAAYTPATIALTVGSATDIFGARMLPVAYTGGSSGTVVTTNDVNATWVLSEAVNGGSNATITLQWPASLEMPGFSRAFSRLAQYSSAKWNYGPSDIAAAGSNPYTVSRSGFTSLSEFAVSMFKALPVSWLSISGQHINNNNIIDWSVASELNNEEYIIEASTDGSSFVGIGSVKGAGTTNNEQHYQYTHVNASAPVYFYRIKQVDLDGKFSYSKTVKIIAGNKPLGTAVSIINNPVRDEINMAINSHDSFRGDISILDAVGKLVYKQTVQVNAGSSVTAIRPSWQVAGIYYLVLVKENGEKIVTRLLKQ